MLSDDTISNLVDTLVRREEIVNNRILRLLAKRINEVGKLNESDLIKLETLLNRGGDVRKIKKLLADLTKRQVKDITKIIKESAKNSYTDTKKYYDANAIPFIPFEDNVQLQRIVNTIAKQTLDTYTNLANTKAFMIWDASLNRYRPTEISKAYVRMLDEAITSSQSGLTSWESEKKRIVRNLLKNNIKVVEYQKESGKRHTQRVDSAVRRNLLDGIRAINQGVQDETGKQFGADGKEITVHRYPAPDHAPVQGHQFTNTEFDKLQNSEDFKDVNGKEFKGFKRSIGQWNCRHFTFSIIIGYANPNYTDEQLQKILDENEKGFTTSDGKHLTMYECTQMQRKYELQIRQAKENYIIAKEAQVEELMDQYKQEVKDLTNEYKKFSKDCGLSVKMKNCYVEGY